MTDIINCTSEEGCMALNFGIALAPPGQLCVPPSGAFAQNPVPFISQPLMPDAIAPGRANFTLTVNGTSSGHSAVWLGLPQPVPNHNPTQEEPARSDRLESH